MREDIALEIHSNSLKSESLCFVDGHRKGRTDGQLCPLEHKGPHGLGHHDLGDEDLVPQAGAVADCGLDGVGEDFGHHHSRPIGDALGDVAEGNDRGPHLEPDDMGSQATLLDAGKVLL